MNSSSACNMSCTRIELSRETAGEDRFTITVLKPENQGDSSLWTSPPLSRDEAVEHLRKQGVEGDIQQMLQDLFNYADSEGQGSDE